jgi:SSS family solute:Na+ symporter
MSIKDPGQFRWTAVVGTLWNVLMAGGALMVGLVGRAYFPEVSSLPAGDAEKVYPELGQLLGHPIFFGFLMASIFSAIMSTADSQLLVAASSVVRDLYQRIIRNGAELSQQRLVLMSRSTVAILTIIAVGLSVQAQALVFWLVLFAWAGLGAALGSTSILALFWERTTKPGVVGGLLVGTGTVIAWNQIPMLKDTIYELIPAFFLALAVIAGLSLLTPTDRSTRA